MHAGCSLIVVTLSIICVSSRKEDTDVSTCSGGTCGFAFIQQTSVEMKKRMNQDTEFDTNQEDEDDTQEENVKKTETTNLEPKKTKFETPSVLQEGDDDSEETQVQQSAVQDVDEAGSVEAKITKHGAFTIRSFSNSHVKRWNLMMEGGCDKTVVDKLTTECNVKGMKINFKGDPAAGGMCYVVQTGTEEDMKEEIDKCEHLLDAKLIVEEDIEVQTIPEVPGNDDDDLALLESAGPTALWGLDRIDETTGLDNDYAPHGTGAGIHVFVFDTGIRTTHTDFGGRAFPALEVLSDVPKECSKSDVACAADLDGHGTHCAGTIGGQTYGVAKGVSLHSVKILGVPNAEFSWVFEAFDWVERQQTMRPAIASLSLGSVGPYVSEVARATINDATQAGVMVVVAAGNSNADACTYTPSFVPSAIVVGSMQKGDQRSSFSNYGNCLDIFAPGTLIKSTSHDSDTGSLELNGTSMACPHVAGALAVLWEADTSRTCKQVEDLLLGVASQEKVQDAKGSPNKLLYVKVAECSDGLPLIPVSPSGCPADGNIKTCDSVGPGELCEGDGECNTNPLLDNCPHHFDIYRKSTVMLQVTIRAASNLPNIADYWDDPDVYVEVEIAHQHGSRMATGIRKNTVNPIWNEKLNFPGHHQPGDKLIFTIWDEDILSSHEKVGVVEFVPNCKNGGTKNLNLPTEGILKITIECSTTR